MKIDVGHIDIIVAVGDAFMAIEVSFIARTQALSISNISVLQTAVCETPYNTKHLFTDGVIAWLKYRIVQVIC